MLAIKIKRNGVEGWISWWIGYPVPKDIGRVVQFQADGDELQLFLDAMSTSAGENRLVEYTKPGGFNLK